MDSDAFRAAARRVADRSGRDLREVMATALAAEIAPLPAGRRLTLIVEDVTERGVRLGSFIITVEQVHSA